MYCNVGWDFLLIEIMEFVIIVCNIENCLNIDICNLIEIKSLDYLV